uniref:Uncharacterized protein n=1 Tax=Astyanax mexicanus TaxID=7994 RepID=A0A8B9KE67_ASTMX
SKIERFLQRVSLVNSQVWPKTPEMSTFSVGCLPSCCQMHLVFGEKLHLLLPSEAVEAGLYGEISLTCLATLGPCMNRYPNWPARLSHIHISLKKNLQEEQTQLSFIQSLADLPFWRKLGLTGVYCAYTDTAQGSQFYEVEFSTEDEHHPDTEPAQSQAVSEDPKSEVPAVEQTITVLLLIQHSDPFHSQLFDFISSEEILEKQLDSVLWCNAKKVRLALQSLLENTLKGFLNRKKKRQTTMSVIVDSVNSIVSSSSNAEFRSACLHSMKVFHSYLKKPNGRHMIMVRVMWTFSYSQFGLVLK